MAKIPVLLLGLHETAIMTARCFSQAGIKIHGMDYNNDQVGFYSNQIKAFKMPSPAQNERDWLNYMQEWLTKSREKFVLIPTSDEFIMLAAKYKYELADHVFGLLPDYNVISSIVNRDIQFALAARSGIPVPSYVVGPLKFDEIRLRYPLAIKPIDTLEWRRYFNNKGFVVENQNELKSAIVQVNKYDVRYMVQEIITGGNTNNYEINSLYLPNGEYFNHSIRKIRQLPDQFGTATCIEANSNRRIEILAEKFIKKIGLYGFSNLELKYDKVTDQFYYIEINPRVWLQVNFTAKLGQNYPLMYYKYVTGESSYRIDKIHIVGKWIDPIPDFLFYLRYRKRDKIKFRQWLRDWFPLRCTGGLLSFLDPCPFLKEYQFGIRFLKIKKVSIQR